MKTTLSIATNARSNTYRFTVLDFNDPSIEALRAQVKATNKSLKKRYDERDQIHQRMGMPLKRRTYSKVSIRARGPRPHPFSHDTPHRNATHFDVYVQNRYEY